MQSESPLPGTSREKNRLVIIGVGNEYRRDDGVGPFIARNLEDRELPGTLVRFHNGDGAEMMEAWRDSRIAILLDAVNSGGPPGRVSRFEADRRPVPARFFSLSTHDFGLAEAVEVARALGRLPRKLIVYGIEGKRFDGGFGLSCAVEKAARRVEQRVIADIFREIRSRVASVVRAPERRKPS